MKTRVSSTGHWDKRDKRESRDSRTRANPPALGALTHALRIGMSRLPARPRFSLEALQIAEFAREQLERERLAAILREAECPAP